MYTCENFIRKDWNDDTNRFIEKHIKQHYSVDYDVKLAILDYIEKHKKEYKNCTLDAVWAYKGIFNRIDLDDFNPRPRFHDVATWFETFLVDDWLYNAQITNQRIAKDYDLHKEYENKLKEL